MSKRITLTLPDGDESKELHKKLKQQALELDMTLEELVYQLLNKEDFIFSMETKTYNNNKPLKDYQQRY